MPERPTLVLATEGPCVGHLCDNCGICRRGKCCGRDHPGYRLPETGDWDGPIHGEIGVLDDDGSTVGCHACGTRHKILVPHILAKHNLTPKEYRSLFGLNATCRLASSQFRSNLSRKNKELLDRIRTDKSSFSYYTAEKLHMVAKGSRRVQGVENHKKRWDHRDQLMKRIKELEDEVARLKGQASTKSDEYPT
jgi:hypothetical protein